MFVLVQASSNPAADFKALLVFPLTSLVCYILFGFGHQAMTSFHHKMLLLRSTENSFNQIYNLNLK